MEQVLFKLEDLVYEKLDEIVKEKDISPTELENATNAVCLLLKIKELEDEGMYENSEMDYSNKMSRRGRYSNGYSDGMHIIPDMDRGYQYRYYSMNNGYSRHSIKDRAIDRLERMMDETQSENERESIKKMIVGLEHMELY